MDFRFGKSGGHPGVCGQIKNEVFFFTPPAGASRHPCWWHTFGAGAERVGGEIGRGEPSPLVLKPLFGSQGRGLKLIYSPEELPPPATVSGVYYLQRYVGVERDGFHDFRVLVSQRRVVAAMMRHSAHWVT